MSLKFNEAIQIVTEKIIESPKPKYQTYLRDAAEISAKLDQELIKINSIFKGTISNWDETTKFSETEVPTFKMPFLRLKMPFTVEPQRVLVFNSVDGEPVNLKTSVNHPAVENLYLNGEKLTQLFIWDLNRVLDRISKLTCSSGKMYKLCMKVIKNECDPYFIFIRAMENDVPSITYSFVISFKFTNKSSHYIYDTNFFRQTDESGIIADIKKIQKLRHNVLILLQTLVNQSSSISPIGLRLILDSMEIESEVGIGSLLLEAIPRFIPQIQNPGPFISAYGKLLQFKETDSVQLSELKQVFGLK